MSKFTAKGTLLSSDSRRIIAGAECSIILIEPSRSQRGRWFGTLTITGDQRGFQRVALQEGEFILRLGDGREGGIIVTSVPVTPDGIGTISFKGSGPLG